MRFQGVPVPRLYFAKIRSPRDAWCCRWRSTKPALGGMWMGMYDAAHRAPFPIVPAVRRCE